VVPVHNEKMYLAPAILWKLGHFPIGIGEECNINILVSLEPMQSTKYIFVALKIICYHEKKKKIKSPMNIHA
jgi:hypothetical protein